MVLVIGSGTRLDNETPVYVELNETTNVRL